MDEYETNDGLEQNAKNQLLDQKTQDSLEHVLDVYAQHYYASENPSSDDVSALKQTLHAICWSLNKDALEDQGVEDYASYTIDEEFEGEHEDLIDHLKFLAAHVGEVEDSLTFSPQTIVNGYLFMYFEQRDMAHMNKAPQDVAELITEANLFLTDTLDRNATQDARFLAYAVLHEELSCAKFDALDQIEYGIAECPPSNIHCAKVSTIPDNLGATKVLHNLARDVSEAEYRLRQMNGESEEKASPPKLVIENEAREKGKSGAQLTPVKSSPEALKAFQKRVSDIDLEGDTAFERQPKLRLLSFNMAASAPEKTGESPSLEGEGAQLRLVDGNPNETERDAIAQILELLNGRDAGERMGDWKTVKAIVYSAFKAYQEQHSDKVEHDAAVDIMGNIASLFHPYYPDLDQSLTDYDDFDTVINVTLFAAIHDTVGQKQLMALTPKARNIFQQATQLMANRFEGREDVDPEVLVVSHVLVSQSLDRMSPFVDLSSMQPCEVERLSMIQSNMDTDDVMGETIYNRIHDLLMDALVYEPSQLNPDPEPFRPEIV